MAKEVKDKLKQAQEAFRKAMEAAKLDPSEENWAAVRRTSHELERADGSHKARNITKERVPW